MISKIIRATKCSAGYDLLTPVEFTIKASNHAIINTKVYYPDNFPSDTYAMIKSKSGLYSKYGIIAFEGVIDSDYKDPIYVNLYNEGESDYSFNKGDKIAQIIFMNYINIPDEDEVNVKRSGGFGSTGK
jgi:dUTP pyrophosphatase